MLSLLLGYSLRAVGTAAIFYLAFLGLLIVPFIQTHVAYLHAVQMTWFRNLDVPEEFGFLRNQVTPFHIHSGKETIYAWHILPVELYRKNEQQLITEQPGLIPDITSRLGFKLLREDPDALLVIHFHGAGGTVGSGYRTPNYRALSAGNPNKIHILTFDYRGFGRSTGSPTEQGVISDALSIVDWALDVAQIPPSRILFFGQSMGTAVNIAAAKHYAQQTPPIVFAGHVLVAPFVDAPTLLSTYKIAGTIPLLGPVARFPILFDRLRRYVRDQWSTKDRIAEYVRAAEGGGKDYRVTIIHAEDDYDIPWTHTEVLFGHAVDASRREGIGHGDLEERKARGKVDMGSAGTAFEWRTEHGVIREEILKHGLHDVIMGNPVVTMAVMRMFAERKGAGSIGD